MTTAKRKKAVAAIRQIIKAARELIEIEESASTQREAVAMVRHELNAIDAKKSSGREQSVEAQHG